MTEAAPNVLFVQRRPQAAPPAGTQNVHPIPAQPAPQKPAAPKIKVAPVAAPRKRGLFGVLSFLAVVAVPVGLTAGYLWGAAGVGAADRYETGFSFSVRSETAPPPQGAAMAAMMGGGGNAASDAGVVADFVTSREMVSRLMAAGVDLPGMFSIEAENDPIFSLRNGEDLEAVADYWKRAVTAERDTQTGIVRVNVQAFRPEHTLTIATAALAESQKLVDELSAQAKADIMRSSEAEVERARAEQQADRAALTEFRVENGIVDPQLSLTGRTTSLDELRVERDKILMERANLEANARPGDIRLDQVNLRLRTIVALIAEREAEFGDAQGFARIASQFEDLQARAEFSEMSLRNAMTMRDAARKEADLRGSYLTSHVTPHLAERSDHPDRVQITLIVAGILMGLWLILGLIRSAFREHRK